MVKNFDEEGDYFEIDSDRLREEWLRQMRVYRRHAYLLADARADFERAKAQREVVKAELDVDIRLHPERYRIDKITEKSVEHVVILQSSYQKATEEYIKAKHTLDIHQADVDTLDQKKQALENAVKLLLAGFWGEPRLGSDAKSSAYDYEKQAIRRTGQHKRGG